MRTGGRVVTAFFLLSILLFASPATPASADQGKPESSVVAPIASIADKTKGMEKRDGLLPLYIRRKRRKALDRSAAAWAGDDLSNLVVAWHRLERSRLGQGKGSWRDAGRSLRPLGQ